MTVALSGQSRPTRIVLYARLAKLSFYDYYLSALVAWTLLAPAQQFRVRAISTLVLLTLGWVGVVAATVTFDDVRGFLDGSDRQNYTPESGAMRDLRRKPLLGGGLSPAQAVAFGYGAVLWALALVTAAALVAMYRPGWTLAAAALVVVTSVQYSAGLRLSYRGGQELLLLMSTGLTVLIPYGLLTGQATGMVIAESYLFGLWSLLVSVYSNINDVEGDRAAGRRNLAVLCPPRVYRAIVTALSCTEIGLVLALAAAGMAPRWFPVFMLPLLLTRMRQLWVGFISNDPLSARKLGIQAHRLCVVSVLLINLIIAR